MVKYPLTHSMQFLIDTKQPITEEEQEALLDRRWRYRYHKEEGRDRRNHFCSKPTFGYKHNDETTNHHFLWAEVEVSVYDDFVSTSTLAEIRELLYNRAVAIIFDVLVPMREGKTNGE